MLRQLAEIGGINLVIDPSVPVNAVVDLKLTQVPWDQVMDVVLKSAQLTYQIDGPVVRVLTRDARTRELKDEAEQRKAIESAPALESVRLRLNYASAADIEEAARTGARCSPREAPSTSTSARTCSSSRTCQRTLAEIQTARRRARRPEPQVEIEAQILQTNRDTARALGRAVGLNGRVAPELGNTTALAFPNRGTLGGRVQDRAR